jgi:hypothetical protein
LQQSLVLEDFSPRGSCAHSPSAQNSGLPLEFWHCRCWGLSVFYIKSLGGTLGFTADEQLGLLLCKPLQQISRKLGRHAELEAESFVHHTDNSAQMQQLFRNVDDELKEFTALEKRYGDSNTHTLLQALNDKWFALKAAKSAIIEESLMRHSAALDALFAIKEAISADLKVGLDPEVASYNILDVALAKLPQAERYLSEARVHVAALNDDGEYDPAEGFRLTTLIAVVNERLAAARKQIKLAADAAKDRMMADASGTIIYLNTAMQTLLKSAEADIRRDLPQFTAAEVAGSRLDVFP